MIEFFNAFIGSNMSTFLKVIIILLVSGGSIYNVVRGVLFISSLIFDYNYKKKLRDLDEYVNPPSFK